MPQKRKISNNTKNNAKKSTTNDTKTTETTESPQNSTLNSPTESHEIEEPQPKKIKKPKRLERLQLDQLPDFILEQYMEGLSQNEVFVNACRRLGYRKRKDEKIADWFNSFNNSRRVNGNIADYRESLIRLIHETFHPVPANLVEKEVGEKLNTNKLSIFKSVSNRMRYTQIEDSKILQYFDRFLSNDSTLTSDEIGKENFELVQKITHEVLKRKNLLFEFNGNQLSKCRYGFKITNVLDKTVEITDNLHGKTKELIIKNGILKCHINDTNFEFINNTHLLIIERIYRPMAIIQLAKLDLENWTCEIVDDTYGFFDQYSVVTDQKEEGRFVVLSTKPHDSTIFALYGDLNQNKFTSKRNIKWQENTMCHRFIDNKLFGLKFAYNQETRKQELFYWKSNLNNEDGKDVEIETLFKIEHDDLRDLNLYKFTDYFLWNGDICYTTFYDNNYQQNIYSINVTTKECKLMNFSRAFNFTNIYIRDDGSLICHNGANVYCFGLESKPQSLEYLAWSSIRKAAKEGKTNVYEDAVKRLPLNSKFQPFAI